MQTYDNPRSVPRLLRPEAQSIWARVLLLAAFLAVTSLSAWRVVKSLDDPAVDDNNQGLVDFHNVVYFPAVAYCDGINPYSAAYAQQYPVNRQFPLYSPAIFWLSFPLALLPLGAANFLYYTASLAMVLLLSLTVLAVCRVPKTFCNVIGLATLILVSRPGHINLFLGQVTLPMVLGALWALELADRRPLVSGLGLALTTIKPTFGVPLVWLMFCRRDFRAVFVGLAITGAATAAGAAPIVARYGWKNVLESLAESQSLHEGDPVVAPVTSWTRIDVLAIAGKLMGREPGHYIELAITVGCLVASGWMVWRIRRTRLAQGADSISALIIATATLACIYHSTYDALLLAALWVGAAVGRLRQQLPPRWRVAVWLLITIPAINYFSAREFARLFSITGPTWTVLTMVNSCSILAVLIIAATVALRSPHAASD